MEWANEDCSDITNPNYDYCSAHDSVKVSKALFDFIDESQFLVVVCGRLFLYLCIIVIVFKFGCIIVSNQLLCFLRKQQ